MSYKNYVERWTKQYFVICFQCGRLFKNRADRKNREFSLVCLKCGS